MIASMGLLLLTAVLAIITAAIVGWPITLGIIGLVISVKIFKKIRS